MAEVVILSKYYPLDYSIILLFIIIYYYILNLDPGKKLAIFSILEHRFKHLLH